MFPAQNIWNGHEAQDFNFGETENKGFEQMLENSEKKGYLLAAMRGSVFVNTYHSYLSSFSYGKQLLVVFFLCNLQ